MLRHALAIGLLAVTACAPAQTVRSSTAPPTFTPPPTCTPTRADVPANYKPDAPVRNKIGAGGYVIEGIVMRVDCTPVPDARIEFWLVNQDGKYDDDHRATVVADERGR
jgi:protocatechuate 3,4-dioxygenase beta subunit